MTKEMEQDSDFQLQTLDPLQFAFFDEKFKAQLNDNLEGEDESGDEEREYWASVANSQKSLTDIFDHAPNHGNWEDFNENDAEENELQILKDQMELESELKNMRVGGKRKAKKSEKNVALRSVLSPIGKQKLGMANSAFIDGDYERAIDICRGIANEFPDAAEPYQTLAIIHEEMEDLDKCILFYMIASHLRPSDVNLWRKSAQLAKENSMMKEAAYCFRKALNADPNCFEAYEECAQILLDLGSSRKALKVLLKLFAVKQCKDIDLAHDISQLYVELGAYEKALFVYRTCIRNRGVSEDSLCGLTTDQINVLSELYLLNKNYLTCLSVLESCANALTELPIDLKIKLAVCYIHLGRSAEASTLFECLDGISVKEAPDLYYDIAVAYFETSQWNDALNLMKMVLSETDEYNDINTWLRVGICLEKLELTKDAVEYYLKVLDQNPFLVELKLIIADLLFVTGDRRGAEVIRQLKGSAVPENLDESAAFDCLYQMFLSEKFAEKREILSTVRELLSTNIESLTDVAVENAQQCLQSLILVFNSHPRFFRPRCRNSEKVVRRRRRSTSRAPEIPDDVHSQSEVPTDSETEPAIISSSVAIEGSNDFAQELVYGLQIAEWFEVNCMYCQTLTISAQRKHDSKQFESGVDAADILLQQAFDQLKKLLKASTFKNESYRSVIRLALLGLCSRTEDIELGYVLFRKIHQRCSRFPWFVSAFQTLTGNSNAGALEFISSNTPQKYFTRYLKCSDFKDPYLTTNLGYMFMLKRGFVYSLQFFGRVHNMLKQDLTSLLLAAALTQRACQRRTPNRHGEILQAFAFLEQYKEARRGRGIWKEQECHFNYARILSHVGIYDMALAEYETCVKLSLEAGERNQYLDLKHEAIHNMRMILSYVGSDLQANLKHLSENEIVI